MAYYDFRHRERTTYQDFMEEVEVVFASPQSAFFGGEHAVIDGGIAVVQHLDRYVWAGVRRIEGKEPRVQPLVWVPTLADHRPPRTVALEATCKKADQGDKHQSADLSAV